MEFLAALRGASMVVAVAALGACIGTTPEEQAQADLGDHDDGDEEHRPGQPCLDCHSKDFNPGGDVFVVAGTIYRRVGDSEAQGVEDAEVEITDDDGRTFVARTNRVGNFMVEVKPGESTRQKDDGKLRIGWEPRFPLRTLVRFGSEMQEMDSYIWRDGSCASCHRGDVGVSDREPKVFTLDETPDAGALP
jgi:hypothetical protein